MDQRSVNPATRRRVLQAKPTPTVHRYLRERFPFLKNTRSFFEAGLALEVSYVWAST